VFLSIFSTSIVASLELASSPFPPMILAYFFRDLEEEIYIYNLHQLIPPLSEGNPLDLDLGVIG
jgi:hypothetical protein